ncbi:MAG: hypothetical protein EXS03_05095 [Phycisphaerales bacterium]|nr:hypothetical protein [Phycisphaerales bacterium]
MRGGADPHGARDEGLTLELPDHHEMARWRDRPEGQRWEEISLSRQLLGIGDGFVAGTGHQPQFFHAGIFAKFIAADALATTLSGGVQWIHFVSDTDTIDPLRIELPSVGSDGRIRKGSLRLARGTAPDATDAAACARGVGLALTDEAAQVECARLSSDRATKVFTQVTEALAIFADAPNAAMQAARASAQLMRPVVSMPGAILSTAALLAAPIGMRVVREILARPLECARSFNAALAHAPHAAMPLRESGSASEVPLWGIDAHGGRERLDAAKASERLERGELILPRAFVASGLMRLLTDLFVHGTGGANYERASEAWWRDFLQIELPPFVVASASLYPTRNALGLSHHIAPPARVAYRKAWWNPAVIDALEGSPILDARRTALLAQIASAPRKTAARKSAYLSLRAHIDAARVQRARALSELDTHEQFHARALREDSLREDRTWPYLLIDPSEIDELSATIRSRIQTWAGEGSRSGSGR